MKFLIISLLRKTGEDLSFSDVFLTRSSFSFILSLPGLILKFCRNVRTKVKYTFGEFSEIKFGLPGKPHMYVFAIPLCIWSFNFVFYIKWMQMKLFHNYALIFAVMYHMVKSVGLVLP
jgi:hypothetical protein